MSLRNDNFARDSLESYNEGMRAIGERVKAGAPVPAFLQGRRDLDHYDPQRGLKTIAVAEAAESYYRRARDAAKLFEAIELKLTEQRKFVRWYKAQPKDKGAATERGDRTVTTLDIPAVFGVDPADVRAIKTQVKMLSRWRKALLDDAAFDDALEDARHRALRICEQEQTGTVRGTEGTGEFELYTPAHYIEAAREVLGEIDLDPASNEIAQSTVQARDYFNDGDEHGRRRAGIEAPAR